MVTKRYLVTRNLVIEERGLKVAPGDEVWLEQEIADRVREREPGALMEMEQERVPDDRQGGANDQGAMTATEYKATRSG